LGDTPSYLTINGMIKDDDYQWTFFVTEKYINDNTNKYSRELDIIYDCDNDVYYIETDLEALPSFLVINNKN
jgi:hypothetical protein